jgi:hypothetical protein
MLEPQALHRVIQLDIHAEIVGVQLQLIPRHQAALLIHIHHQRRHRAVIRNPPVPVTIRTDPELNPLAVGFGRGRASPT